jgi:class 3 adenylate cyclase/tetratricopeptide (TPR) repeat protein
MDLGRFLPLTLRRLVAEGRDWESPLFLNGATLFADISGFTPLSEALGRMGREGAEFLTRTLNDYFGAIVGAIEDRGGDVMRFAGDAATALFQDPGGLERALEAARAIQAHMAENPEAVSPVGAFPIRIKIGLAAGEHVLLVVGEGAARDYVFAGLPVDGAAEAEHHARAGETVVKAKRFNVQHPKFKVEKRAEGFWRIEGFPPPLETRNSKLETVAVEPDRSSLTETCAPFLHPILVERLRLGSERLLSEHRRAAVLFVSFPNTGDYRDPEAVARLRAFYAEARALVDACEGHLSKVDMGDKGSKLLITFGAPLSHEDDADRAVHFALDLQAIGAARGLAPAVGLNRGTIFAGLIGDARRCEYTVMGDEVNLAARLMQAAGPGRILAGPGAYEECRAFSFTPLPPVALKGKSHPVPVFEPRREEAGEKATAGAFIGRARELEECGAFIRESGEATRLLLVQGEAGIGKSAFLEHLFCSQGSGRRVVSGWCREFTAQFPYHPWKFILRRLLELGTPEGGTPEEAWKGLLERTVPELVPFAPLLLDLMEVPHGLKAVSTDEQTRKAILHRQAGLLISESARREPLTLSLTDVQWMDPESRGLLTDLLRTLDRPGPLFVLSGRTLPGGLEGLVPTLSITLGPQPETDLRRLALAFLRVQRAPDKLLADAVAASGGNPLLLRETLRAYEDSGYITRDAQNPELLFLDEMRKPNLPTTLEGVVMARFDRLPASQQLLLKTLAVFGETIPKKAAYQSAIDSGADPQMLDALSTNGEFIRRLEREDQFIFPQSHIRSTIYNSLDFGSRKNLHLRAARIARTILPADSSDAIRVIAFHYLCSGAVGEGQDYLYRAGQLYHDEYALSTAVQYFQALIQSHDEITCASSAMIAHQLCSIYLAMGKFHEVQCLLSPEFLKKIEESDVKAQLLLALADSYRLSGSFGLVEPYLDEAFGLAGNPLICFQCHNSRGMLLAQTGQLGKALNLFNRVRQEFTGQIPSKEIVKLSVVQGALLFATGGQDQAVALLQSTKRKLKALNEIQHLIRVHINLGTIANMQSNPGKALRSFLEAKRIQERFGLYQHMALASNEAGYIYMLSGKWDEARYHLDLSYSKAQQMCDPIQVRALSNLSELSQYHGAFDAAREHLIKAVDISRQYGFEQLQVLFYWVEFFANLPYPAALGRVLGQFHRRMIKENALYLQSLYWGYLSIYFALMNDRDRVLELAEETCATALARKQAKEAYLAARALVMIDPEDEEKVGRLSVLAKATNLEQFRLDSIIWSMRNHGSDDLLRQGDAAIKKTPFANLAWRFHLVAARHALNKGRIAMAKRRATSAQRIHARLRESIPWRAARQYWNSQPDSILLKELLESLGGTGQTDRFPACRAE